MPVRKQKHAGFNTFTNLLKNSDFHAVSVPFRLFLLAYILFVLFNLKSFFGNLFFIYAVLFSALAFVQTLLLKEVKPRTFFTLPASSISTLPFSFAVAAFILTTILNLDKISATYLLFLAVALLVASVPVFLVSAVLLFEVKSVKFRYVMYALSALAILLFSYSVNPMDLISDLNVKELQECGVDADCVAVTKGCCDCSGGGSRIAINSQHVNRYGSYGLFRCGVASTCFQGGSADFSCFAEPKCLNGMCVLDAKDGVVCEDTFRQEGGRGNLGRCYYSYCEEIYGQGNASVEECVQGMLNKTGK